MITEKDLQEAIAECEGQRNPNASTCLKLAAFYTIRRELFGEDPAADIVPGYSRATDTDEPCKTVTYDSGSRFSEVIHGKDLDGCLSVLDEMMDALQILNPRLYDGVMRKLNEV